MSLQPGQEVELVIEKPAAGGRMIARHDRQVILVRGAIPGERVRGRIERVERQLAFAETVHVSNGSPDRRDTAVDTLCGGCLYAHVDYPRQLTLKADVIRDALVRVGRITLAAPIDVAPSPERGYRMRARLHVRGDRIGFYREGTHDLCDAAATGQLSETAVASAGRAVASLVEGGCAVSAVELAENLAADQRVLHVTTTSEGQPTNAALDAAVTSGRLTGCTGMTPEGTLRTSGVPVVTDPLAVLTGGRARSGELQRHAESFFQVNRFLLPALVATVLERVIADADVLDLYAGVGLFSVSLAACGQANVTAVEGDRTSGTDLQRNATMNGAAVRVVIASVEEYLARRRRAVKTMIVDPPRTGISRDAMKAIVAHRAERIIHVSCDPPTMARDARRLLDARYRISELMAFDLFPNTPHVETVGVFDL
jgi:23S rRNA (uracil1939-C5)-methyltransferase